MRYLHVNPPVCTDTYMRLNQCLGGPLLVAAAHVAGWDGGYLDAEALGYDKGRTLEEIRRLEPDVVGVTALTRNMDAVRWLLGAMREAGIYAMVGGPHAVAAPDDLTDVADLVVIGEADLALAGLLDERPCGVRAVEPPPDLDVLPRPAWEFCWPSPNTYKGNAPRFTHPEACLVPMRGCPHACGFCSLPLGQGASLTPRDQQDRLQPLMRRPWIRYQSAAKIVDEVRYLRDRYGVRHVFMYADELVGAYGVQRDWALSTWAEVARADLNVTWKAQGRCSARFVTDDVLEAMRAAGCVAIMWGIETGSEKVARALRKGTTPEDVIVTLARAKRAGLFNFGFFMAGCPEETEQEAVATEALIQELKARKILDGRQVTICTPEINTPLWARAEAEGWLPRRNPARRWHYTPSDTPWMAADRAMYWRGRLEGA